MQISANVFSAGLSAIKTGQEQLANAAQAIAQSSQNSASSSAAATAATAGILRFSMFFNLSVNC